MDTAEICLLIMVLYTLVLIIIAANYSTRTIETLGDLVHQLINKVDSHNETILKDIEVMISAITGQPLSEDNDKGEAGKSDVESDMQYLYENLRPTNWTSVTRYKPIDDNDDTEVSKTTVMNPYDEKNVTKSS